MVNIFAGGLPYNLSESELRDFFTPYGEVRSVKIIREKSTGRGKGYGFIEMPDETQASNAIEALNGSEVDGKRISVNRTEIREDDNKKATSPSQGKRGDYRERKYEKTSNPSRTGYNKQGNNNGNLKKGGSRRVN